LVSFPNISVEDLCHQSAIDVVNGDFHFGRFGSVEADSGAGIEGIGEIVIEIKPI
jgi:hypothetical protein